MSIRVGINGFGRIGRHFFRAANMRNEDIEFVAVNGLGPKETMAHLLQYDSMSGRFEANVEVNDQGFLVDGHQVTVLSESNPKDLRWGDIGVDVVVEATGQFNTRDAAAAHLDSGAPYVIVSAPAAGADATFVVGVNDDTFDPAQHKVISNASCTTNCFVPMIKVLDDAFGVEKGLMTTVHAYTGDQNLVDGSHRDLRRARAAAINIAPTSTGAARSTGLVLQSMEGKLDGISLRVPVAAGSITDFVGHLSRNVTVEEVNEAFQRAATEGPLAGILEYSEAPLVSSDILGSTASCVYDAPLTLAMDNLVKIFGWYDNEVGYSNRLLDLVLIVGSATQG
ncbi:MAG: type I glyceraldehyde-3-phosphate dehydrogenase [Acidimicrobiia bacterium]